MVKLRIIIALVALSGFGWLIVTVRMGNPMPGDDRLANAVHVLLIPLIATAIALARGAFVGRWAAVAAGFAVLPWATVLVLTPLEFEGKARAGVALACSLAVLSALLGRQMFDTFEGRSSSLDWRGDRMGMVRWAIIASLAGGCTLYLFAVAYEPTVRWHSVIPGVFLVVLICGAWFLAYQKTIGLLFVGGGSLGLIPAGAYFMLHEAQSPGEAGLFVALLLPSIVMGCVLFVTFGRPVLRLLRAR